jgi:hypothetical protein
VPDRRRTPAPPQAPITAAARTYQATQGTSQDRVFAYESWQQEAWGFFDNLGEFRYGVEWLSAALSRVRLTAAELVPGGEEPKPLTEGPAAQLVEALGGSVAGRATLMKSLAAQLSVPGEGWLVAERADDKIPLEQADWSIKSTDEIRPARGGSTAGYEVRVDDNAWRPLHPDSLPVRIWNAHARWSWKADSAARAAIPIMRTIELLNRRIIATLVSRLAMNGLLLIPQEGDITTPPEYVRDGEDPFVNMLIDIAGRNIREPGAATASIPIPIKFPAQFIEQWKHLTFGDGIDEGLLKERDEELGRLATTLNMPAEILTGVAAANHWTAWALEEAAIKLHISPVAETIVGGLTVGYLVPMLQAMGEDLVGPNGGKIVVWYDPSELTARPDKSAQAQAAHDGGAISDAAYLRELGLDDADKPTDAELQRQLLVRLASMGNADAYNRLFGDTLAPTPGARAGGQTPTPGGSQPSGPGDTGGTPALPVSATRSGVGTPPPTRDEPPPLPDDAMAALATRLGFTTRQAFAAVGTRTPPPPTNGHHDGSSNGKARSRDGPRGRRR